jgi:hypothetical protein
MTVPDLADALAAQRAAYRPHAVPPFTGVLHRKRRRDRRRRAAMGAGLAAVAGVAALSAVPMVADRDAPPRDRVGATSTAPAPDRQRVQAAFAELRPTVTDIPPLREARPGFGGRPRTHGPGLQAETLDRTFSLSWVVLAPALTDAEGLALVGTMGEGESLEQGVPVALATEHVGAVRSAAFRYDDGSFLRLLAWSTDGGFVSLTSGRGATTTDAQVGAWAASARSLLEP